MISTKHAIGHKEFGFLDFLECRPTKGHYWDQKDWDSSSKLGQFDDLESSESTKRANKSDNDELFNFSKINVCSSDAS